MLQSRREQAGCCGQCGYRAVKRVLDVVISAAAFVMLAPLLLAIGMLVKLTSAGPVLYRHVRVGRYGVPFTLYKFRTMVQGADGMLPLLPFDLQAEYRRSYKLQHDPRTTGVGRVLRRYCLDELPQLYNVLRGEMSLVGPRPVVEEELSFYGEQRSLLLQVPPGMTGYWQINGHSAIPYDKRVALELFYACHCSLWLDAVIILQTPAALLGWRRQS